MAAREVIALNPLTLTLVAMPPWEKRKSLLLRRMAAREVRAASVHDPSSWAMGLPSWGSSCSKRFPDKGWLV